jgi:DNA invertase Pin-like site-specific DNA recombinase
MDRQPVDDAKAQRLLDAGASVREAAAALGVTPQAIYRRISIGKLTRAGA